MAFTKSKDPEHTLYSLNIPELSNAFDKFKEIDINLCWQLINGLSEFIDREEAEGSKLRRIVKNTSESLAMLTEEYEILERVHKAERVKRVNFEIENMRLKKALEEKGVNVANVLLR